MAPLHNSEERPTMEALRNTELQLLPPWALMATLPCSSPQVSNSLRDLGSFRA